MPAPGQADLGFVGEIERVNAERAGDAPGQGLHAGHLAGRASGADGASYNINADVAAAEIAAACGAERLIFLTDVAGLLDEDGNLISEIRAARSARRASASHQGRHAREGAGGAAGAGQRRRAVHIVDGRTPHSIVAELFTDHGVGTLVT